MTNSTSPRDPDDDGDDRNLEMEIREEDGSMVMSLVSAEAHSDDSQRGAVPNEAARLRKILSTHHTIDEDVLKRVKELHGFKQAELDVWHSTFLHFDSDRSGHIQLDEIKEMVQELGLGLSDDKVEDMFKEADADRSGQIGFEEFVEVFHGASKKVCCCTLSAWELCGDACADLNGWGSSLYVVAALLCIVDMIIQAANGTFEAVYTWALAASCIIYVFSALVYTFVSYQPYFRNNHFGKLLRKVRKQKGGMFMSDVSDYDIADQADKEMTKQNKKLIKLIRANSTKVVELEGVVAELRGVIRRLEAEGSGASAGNEHSMSGRRDFPGSGIVTPRTGSRPVTPRALTPASPSKGVAGDTPSEDAQLLS